MKIFQTKVVEKFNTNSILNNLFSFFFENRAVYEIMWKNNVQPQITIWGIGVSCWKTKDINTHSDYVTLIAFLLQQCFQ